MGPDLRRINREESSVAVKKDPAAAPVDTHTPDRYRDPESLSDAQIVIGQPVGLFDKSHGGGFSSCDPGKHIAAFHFVCFPFCGIRTAFVNDPAAFIQNGTCLGIQLMIHRKTQFIQQKTHGTPRLNVILIAPGIHPGTVNFHCLTARFFR